MRTARRKLFETLQGKQPVNSEEPFANIKRSLGSLSNVPGNPLTKSEFSINVDVFFIDSAAHTIIAPAAVPAVAQTELPVYFLGTNDMYNAYHYARFFAPLNPNWFLIGAGFQNYNYNGIALDAILLLQVEDGDYITYFAPTVGGVVRAMIRIRCENTGYSSLVHGLIKDTIIVNTIRYSTIVASILQFTHPLIFTHISLLGKLASDTIDPRLYILPTNPQQTISDIPVKLPFDNKMILSTQIDFSCQHFNFIFFVEQITN